MASETVGTRLPLAALVAANAVSLLGNTVAAVAIPWFVLVTTGSAARAGIAAFFATLPLAFGAVFGGAVADRVGLRRASVATDLVSAAAIAGIPLLHAAGALEFWHVLALGFAGALFDAPGQAAREALLPSAAERSATPLERATALWTTTEHLGYVAGAPLAGIAIAAVGAPAALWLDAASFAFSAAAVAAAVPTVAGSGRATTYLGDLVEGLRFIARNVVLRAFLTLATVGNFLIAPLATVVLPVYVHERLGGSTDLGILVGVYGAGGLAGAVTFGIVAARVRRRALFVALWAVYPLLSAILVALPPLWLTALAMFLIGLVAGANGRLEQLVRQERTPAELRGRVFATFMASLTLVVPPATLAAGFVVEAAGLRAALVAFAAGNAVLAAFVLASRVRREL